MQKHFAVSLHLGSPCPNLPYNIIASMYNIIHFKVMHILYLFRNCMALTGMGLRVLKITLKEYLSRPL